MSLTLGSRSHTTEGTAPNKEVGSEALKLIRKMRKHIEKDSCSCCRNALTDGIDI